MGYTDGHKGGVKRLNSPTHNDTKGKWYLERKEGRIGHDFKCIESGKIQDSFKKYFQKNC